MTPTQEEIATAQVAEFTEIIPEGAKEAKVIEPKKVKSSEAFSNTPSVAMLILAEETSIKNAEARIERAKESIKASKKKIALLKQVSKL